MGSLPASLSASLVVPLLVFLYAFRPFLSSYSNLTRCSKLAVEERSIAIELPLFQWAQNELLCEASVTHKSLPIPKMAMPTSGCPVIFTAVQYHCPHAEAYQREAQKLKYRYHIIASCSIYLLVLQVLWQYLRFLTQMPNVTPHFPKVHLSLSLSI